MTTVSRILPSPRWLKNNGYDSLYQAMQRCPEAFAHIPQRRNRQPQQRYTLEEHIANAERLAREHGSLPHCHWLYRNGYGGLYQALQDHPEAFRHIERENRRGGTAERSQEWVRVAERLANEHGCLPGFQWLATHGYRGLDNARRRHPELFSHINRRERTCRSVGDWARIAERLIAEYGRLPRYKWLIQNGYRGLCTARAHHAHLFAHLTP